MLIPEMAGVAERAKAPRGDMPLDRHTAQSARDEAHELIATLERDTARSTDLSLRYAQVRLTRHGQAEQEPPILAEASAEFDGRRIRAQIAAATAPEAIDILDRVLRHRISRLARHWDAGLDRQFASAQHVWRHNAEETHRPHYLARPIHERKMLRHKTFELELCTANEAIEDMELMGYPFQLFKGLETGQDSVVYRDGPKGYRLAQVEQRNGRSWGRRPALTVSPRPAVRMSLAEATESLNLTAGPFVFYAEALTGRGRVLYRRYDGHYGLITPAGAGLGPG